MKNMGFKVGNEHWIYFGSVISFIVTLFGVTVGFWLYYDGAVEENSIKRGEYNEQINEIIKFRNKIAKLDIKKFWEEKERTDKSVPAKPEIESGLSIFAQLIEKNVSERPRYTYSLLDPIKVSGLRTNDIKITYMPKFQGLIRTLEELENSERLYSVQKLEVKSMNSKEENSFLFVNMIARMFSEGK